MARIFQPTTGGPNSRIISPKNPKYGICLITASRTDIINVTTVARENSQTQKIDIFEMPQKKHLKRIEPIFTQNNITLSNRESASIQILTSRGEYLLKKYS